MNKKSKKKKKQKKLPNQEKDNSENDLGKEFYHQEIKRNNLLSLNKVELESYRQFRKEHSKCIIGPYGPEIYVTSTPTHLGIGYDVKCKICGVSVDITDIDSW